MSFLLSLFLLFQFPARWASCYFPCAVFSLCSASTAGAFTELGFCCVFPSPCRGQAEVVSARLNPSHSIIYVWEVCNFLDSVSLQQKFEALGGPVLQLRVTAQLYLQGERKVHPWGIWGWADPKDTKRRKAPSSILVPLFVCFFLLPLSLPCVNWASQKAVSFTWGPYSGPWTFLCSVFVGFSLLCLLATTLLDSFFLF